MSRADLEAALLGLLHGPVELLPVSSSGHVAAVPWLLGWEVAGWDGERRKELEVALHAGTAAALLLVLRGDVAALLRGLSRRRARRVRRGARPARGGRAGARAADRAAAGDARARWPRGCWRARWRWRSPISAPGGRAAGSAGAADGLWLGLAQAAALVPGVSRNGATLAAGARARLRPSGGLAALVGGGAAGAVRGGRAEGRAPGAGARRAAERAAARRGGRRPPSLHARSPRGGSAIERRRPLWPWAAWRAGLAGAILVRHRRRAVLRSATIGAMSEAYAARGRRHGRRRPGGRGPGRRAADHRHGPRRGAPCRCPGTTPPWSRWRRTWASPSARTASARS